MGKPRHLWGAELDAPLDPSPELTPGCTLGLLIDHLITRQPRSLLETWWERPMNLRRPLIVLKHAIFACDDLTKLSLTPPSEITGFTHDLYALRSSWYQADTQTHIQTLTDLTDRGCRLCAQIISDVDRLLTADQPTPRQTTARIRIGKTNSRNFNFIRPWTYELAMAQAKNNYQQTSLVDWPSPISFAAVLSVYAQSSPILKHRLKPDHPDLIPDWNGDKWRTGLQHRARCLSNYLFELSQLGMLNINFRWAGLGLEPPIPLWKKIYWLTDHLLRGKVGRKNYVRQMTALVKPQASSPQAG